MALTDTAAKAAQAKDKVYRLADGGSLYLKVTPAGSKIWEFRYKMKGTPRTHVIGPYPEIGVKAARVARDEVRHQTRTTGVDAVTVKQENLAKAKAAAEAALTDAARIRQDRQERAARDRATKLMAAQAAAGDKVTVAHLVRLWTAHKAPSWTPERLRQVLSRMNTHLIPALGERPITTVTMDDILALFATLTDAGMNETARFLRQVTGQMFEWAVNRNKLGKNPVRLAADDLRDRFKRARKTHPVKSYNTINPKELPALLRAMRVYVGTTTVRGLLWFVALTACRTGEARYMTWDEIDFDAGTVTLSAAKMKMDRPHTIYLSAPALAVLREMKQANGHRPFVFPNARRDDCPCCENAVLYALAEIGYRGRMTGHGFRHLFSTMANESGKFRHDVIEAALAHGDENVIRGTYNRAAYVEERVKLAAWWAKTLQQQDAANVVPMRRAS